MRKKSVINDFRNKPYPGSLIMDKTNNFMNSILMDVNDNIRVTYYYTPNDLSLQPELLEILSNVNYDTIKRDSVEIYIDEKQSDFDNEKNTSWIIKFDYKNLLREYLYNEIYTLNPNSPFREIPTNLVNTEEIGDLCYDYIDKNLLNLYEVKDFYLWTKYYDLNLNTVPGSGVGTGVIGDLNPSINLLYRDPKFTFRAIPDTVVDDNKESITLRQNKNEEYLIGYKQTKSSQFQTFIFYYDVFYQRK